MVYRTITPKVENLIDITKTAVYSDSSKIRLNEDDIDLLNVNKDYEE